MIVEVLHPGRANVSKGDLNEKIAALYKADKERVVTFGLRTHFGGGRSTGFALIYDDEAVHKRFEPRYRLVRVCIQIVCQAFHPSQVYFNRAVWPLRSRKPHVNCVKNVRIVQRKCVELR